MGKSATSMDFPSVARTDGFGCDAEKLSRNQSLYAADLTILRKTSDEPAAHQVITSASDRGFVVGVSSRAGHTRRIYHEHHATSHLFENDAVYVRSLGEDYKADLETPFDFVLLEISPKALSTIADDADLPNVCVLNTVTGDIDPVLANLARALIPALDEPETANNLFVSQLAAAIGTHVVQRYGGRAATGPSGRRKLSRLQESIAKSIIMEKLDGSVSIPELAEACGLSRGYFIHAFRATTGMTPYQWLLRERIGKAKALLKNADTALSEVAVSCGFSDQSHFTRVFSTVVGTTPGNWRRNS